MSASRKHATLVDFLICDDIRHEADGRYSLMGVYPGRTVSAPQLPTILPQLAFVFRVEDLHKPTETSLTIVAPDGHESRTASGRRLAPETDAGEALLFVQAAPIQLSVPGEHQVRLKLGDRTETSSFQIQQPA